MGSFDSFITARPVRSIWPIIQGVEPLQASARRVRSQLPSSPASAAALRFGGSLVAAPQARAYPPKISGSDIASLKTTAKSSPSARYRCVNTSPTAYSVEQIWRICLYQAICLGASTSSMKNIRLCCMRRQNSTALMPLS